MLTIGEMSALSALSDAAAEGYYDIDLAPYPFSEDALRIARALLKRGNPTEQDERAADFYRRWHDAVARPGVPLFRGA
jgi:hypothetical protein